MELGKLTAVFDADTRKFDVGLKSVQSKLGGVTSDLSKTTGRIGGLTGALNPANAGLSSLSSNLGAVAGISVVATTAIGGAIGGLFRLAQETAKYAGGLQDLNDQTGIGVANLSALKLAFDQSGGSIDSGATALSRYLRSVSDASTGNEKLKQKFLDVGFTVDDLNKSYGDSDKAIEILVSRVGGLGNSQDRLNALQKVGVRNGQELNGAIVAMNGNLKKFREEAERLGLVVTPEQAKAADDFDDSLKLLEKQVKGMSFQIAHQYLPEISGAIHDVSSALASNRNGWAAWGEFIKTEIRGVRIAASSLAAFMGSIMQMDFAGALGVGLAAGITKSRELHNQDFLKQNVGAGVSVFDAKPRTLGLGGGGGGGRGGGGGGKAQKDTLEALKNEVISLNTEFRKLDTELFNSANMTELAAEKEKILSAVMGQLSDKNKMAVSQLKDVDQALDEAIGKLPAKSQAAAQALREQALAQFKSNEQTRIAGELTKATESLAKEWRQEIENVRTGADSYTLAIQGLEKEYRKYGQTLSDATRKELENAAAMQRTLALTRERLTITAQTRPRFAIENVDRDAGNATRERIATVEEQIIRERAQILRQQMNDLGQQLTNIFSDSIHTGFDRGVKAGLATLLQGLLQIVEQVFLRKLAEGLGSLLGDIATGGGPLSNILGGLFPNIGGPAPGAGGTGATRPRTVTPRDIDGQTRSINSATTQQTQAVSNQIQVTGQQIVQGLTPVKQGGWAGFLNAVIGGAISGLAGSIGGGGGEDWSNEGPRGPRPTTPPVMRRRAGGGPVSAMSPYLVGENGPELFVPQASGNIYNRQQAGGQTIINISLPPLPPGSYKSPASQRQLANQVLSALQGAHR